MISDDKLKGFVDGKVMTFSGEEQTDMARELLALRKVAEAANGLGYNNHSDLCYQAGTSLDSECVCGLEATIEALENWREATGERGE